LRWRIEVGTFCGGQAHIPVTGIAHWCGPQPMMGTSSPIPGRAATRHATLRAILQSLQMPRFVVLLRGVNVGTAKRVPMAEFRALLSALGYSSVATLLNSGNAVFTAASGAPARHAADIASAIASKLKVEVPVVVKSAKELSAIIAGNPIKAEPEEYSRLLVAFAQDSKAIARLAAIEPLVVPPEEFSLGKNAAYLLCAKGILESNAGAALLGRAGKPATSRNWATTLKLQALANESNA
jgi:uncharacterized protein (DUF1697 family)